MPAAVLVGGLVVIALAFAAVAADLLIRQLVINPLNAASAVAAEVAVVGGVIAWILSHLVSLIEISLAGVKALVSTAQNQAADMWNYLNFYTWAAQYAWILDVATWLHNNLPAVQFAAANFNNLNQFVWNHVWSLALSTEANFNNLNAFVWNNVLPLAKATASDLAGLHQWIDGYELPLIRGIGNDLAGLRDWINGNVALRTDVAQAEAQALAQAQALVVPIEIAVQAIENSPCMQYCSPLGDLGQLLQGLEDAGLLAIMIALVQEARTNPGQVATDINNDLAGPIKDVVASLQLGIPN